MLLHILEQLIGEDVTETVPVWVNGLTGLVS